MDVREAETDEAMIFGRMAQQRTVDQVLIFESTVDVKTSFRLLKDRDELLTFYDFSAEHWGTCEQQIH